MRGRRRRVLILVQNLPVPMDRRVWLEARALVEAGFGVSVICPKGPGDPSYAEIEGVRIHKYAPPPKASGPVGYLVEFLYCWLRAAALSVRVYRRDGFSVIQGCNPPDTYWALAALYRPFGVRFVYDQHDLNPEVFVSRFGKPSGVAARLQFRVLLLLERLTYGSADHVISTNESYRRTAIERGGLAPESVSVVRSGPDTSVMRPVAPLPHLRQGRAHLAVYLGVMGPQDGVDLLIRAWRTLVHDLGRTDCQLALLGFGDCYEQLCALVRELDLTEFVTFTGRADARMIAEYLSTADVGLSPDPLNPLNDVSTMNKTMEYMAFALPVVSFDLTETRVSAGPAAVYVEPNDVDRFAKAVDGFLGDPETRAAMAALARTRVSRHLDWRPQADAYVSVFERFLGPARRTPIWPEVDRRSGRRSDGELRDRWGNPLLELRGGRAARDFLRS